MSTFVYSYVSIPLSKMYIILDILIPPIFLKELDKWAPKIVKDLEDYLAGSKGFLSP